MRTNVLKKLAAGALAGAVVISGLGIVIVGNTAKAADTINLNGKYHARLGIQIAGTDWYARMGYFGKKNNPTYGTANDNVLYCDDTKKAAGTFNDVEIAGNGSYEVSLKDAELPGNTTVTQMHIATDIPGEVTNDQIKFKNVKVNINDKDVASFDTAVMEDEQYNKEGRVVLLFNHWRDKLKTVLEKQGVKEGADGYELLKGSGKENITVTFDVEGFGYKKGETPGAPIIYDPMPAPKLGVKKTVGGIQYKVTKSAKKNGTVTAVKNIKKASSRKVPATVTIGGYKFKVTEIGASAFANDKKLTKITIGSNVKKIGAKAFSGDKKLKTITVSSKSITSVGKNALKGVSKDCQVKVPKGKASKYKKLFANKGAKVTVK